MKAPIRVDRLLAAMIVGAVTTFACNDSFMKSSTRSRTSPVAPLGAVSDGTGNVTTTFDPNSKSTQVLQLSQGAVAGAAIALPPGALSVPVSLTVGEGETLASSYFTKQLGIVDNTIKAAGPSVSFIPDSNVEAALPFTLSIPMSASTTLALIDSTENIVVIYRAITVENGETTYVMGLIPGDDVTVSAGKVSFQTTKFGAFQLGKSEKKITDRVVKPSVDPPAFKGNEGTPVVTPTISVASGEYGPAQSVSITTTTSGATIYYTTDGSTPTMSSNIYSAPVNVSSSMTLKAMAIRPNYLDSDVASASYIINGPAATPTVTPAAGNYTTSQSVTLSCETRDAQIYYTLDGSTPTTSSTPYSSPIFVGVSQTIKAIAVKPLYANSNVGSFAYTITGTVQAPTFSVAGGGYGPAQTVTLSSATPGATIYYTTGASDPATSSTKYTAAIPVSTSQTIKAFAVLSNWADSSVSTATYTINGAVATPTFSVAAGAYGPAQTVTLSTATTGATIYYTTNGTDPTTSSSAYSSPILVSSTATVKAFATKATFSDSAIASATYTINGAVATPTASPAAGTYTAAQTVTLSTVTSGAAIYYTLDNSNPTTSSTFYSGTISVAATQTVKAIAVKSNFVDSNVGSFAYTITGTVAAPTFSVAAGAYGPAQTVTLSSATSGATIYYTTNGSTPTNSSTQYTGPITVSSSQTIKAFAVLANWADSSVASAAYTINGSVATPTFSVAAGAYGPAQSVALSTTTAGATIYYTTDGSTPTTSSSAYSSAISVSSSETIKAFATKANFSDSSVATATYTINGAVATPIFLPSGGTVSNPTTVTLSTSTSGASIHYTTDGTNPTSASPVYSGGISVSNSMTIKAIAILANFTDSVIATATYTISGTVATPTFSLAPGSYNTSQSVTISTATSGANIYYTTDGTTPTTSSTSSTTPVTINVSSNMTLSAYASNGTTNSTVVSATYVIDTSVPSLTSASLTPQSPGSTQTPSVLFYSNEDGTFQLFSTSSCSSTSLSQVLTLAAGSNTATTNSLAANATTSIYLKASDLAGNSTNCMIIDSYTHDNIVPLSPIISVGSKSFNAAFNVSIQEGAPADANFKEFRYTTDGSNPNCSTGSSSSIRPTSVGISAATTTLKVITCDKVGLASPVVTNTYTYDNSQPSVTITSSVSWGTNVSPIPVMITFGEPVSGFTSSSLSITNGTVTAFTGSGATYTVNVTPSSQGTVSVSVPAGVAQDSAGNGNTAATAISWTFDSLAPSFSNPSITPTSPSSTNFTPTVSFTLSEPATVSLYSDNACVNALSSSGQRPMGTNSMNTNTLPDSAITSIYIKGVDSIGNSSQCIPIGNYTTQLPAPSSLATPTRYYQQLDLNWALVSGAESYTLYWSNSPGVSMNSNKIIGVVPIYNHNSLTGGTTYYYRVAAVKNGVVGVLSNEVSASPYQNPPPVINSITPNFGPTIGGTQVTISGSGFQSGVNVWIGGVPATSVSRSSATTINAMMPSATSLGAVDVKISNTDGQMSFVSGGFTYRNYFLYVANEISTTISGFGINNNGSLGSLLQASTALGSSPGALAVTPDGKYLYVVSYSGSTLSAFSIDGLSGALSAISGASYTVSTAPSSLAISPYGNFLYVVSQGNSASVPAIPAKIAAYMISSTSGALIAKGEIDLSSYGYNPTSIAVDSSGNFAYVSFSSSLKIAGFSIDQTYGTLTSLSSSPVSLPAVVQSTGKLVTTSTSKLYLAVSTSSGAGIVGYTVDSATGDLTLINTFSGNSTFQLATNPAGNFLFQPSSASSNLFASPINSNGTLGTNTSSALNVISTDFLSQCVDPDGRYLYVTQNKGSSYQGNVYGFSLLGLPSLSSISGASLSTGIGPSSCVIARRP